MLKTIRSNRSLYSEGYGILKSCCSIFSQLKEENEKILECSGLSNVVLVGYAVGGNYVWIVSLV